MPSTGNVSGGMSGTGTGTGTSGGTGTGSGSIEFTEDNCSEGSIEMQSLPLDASACNFGDVHNDALACHGGTEKNMSWLEIGTVDVRTVAEGAQVYRGQDALWAQVSDVAEPSYYSGPFNIDGSRLLQNSSSDELYLRMYVWVPNNWAAEAKIGQVLVDTDEISYALGMDVQRKLFVYPGVQSASLPGGGDYISASAALTEETWQCVEMHLSSSRSEVELWVDGSCAFVASGVDIVAFSKLSVQLGFIEVSSLSGTTQLFIDEAVLDTKRIGCDPVP